MNKKYKPLQYRSIWLMIGYIMIGAVIFVSLHPNPPDTSSIAFGDKLVHTITYFMLMSWFAQIYLRKQHGWIALWLILLGIGIEILQGFSAYRTFEYFDMLANSTGVVLAWLISCTIFAQILIYVERKMKATQ